MYGDIIKKELERSGLSQKELAEKIFVTPQAVSKWLNNLSQPTFDNIKAMTDIFKTDLANKMMADERKTKKTMMQHNIRLDDLDTYNKAKNEAKLILEDSRIEEHYPYSIYKLLEWFITATIGLTYHQSLKPLGPYDEEIGYEDIYYFMNDYFEECFQYPKQYHNQLDYEFYLMGGDYFESFEPIKIPNHDFCRDSLMEWSRFEKAFNAESKKDFDVALADIIASNSSI